MRKSPRVRRHRPSVAVPLPCVAGIWRSDDRPAPFGLWRLKFDERPMTQFMLPITSSRQHSSCSLQPATHSLFRRSCVLRRLKSSYSVFRVSLVPYHRTSVKRRCTHVIGHLACVFRFGSGLKSNRNRKSAEIREASDLFGPLRLSVIRTSPEKRSSAYSIPVGGLYGVPHP